MKVEENVWKWNKMRIFAVTIINITLSHGKFFWKIHGAIR
jgi:hypothetical protein